MKKQTIEEPYSDFELGKKKRKAKVGAIEIPSDHWNLSVSPERFKLLYGDRVSTRIFQEPAKDNDDFLHNYLTSKLWRLNNLYSIVDKDGIRSTMNMHYGQHVVYAATLEHPRVIVLKSRQQGISTLWLISFLDDALFVPDLNIGLMSQGLAESAVLLKRVKLAWDCFPQELKDFLGVSITRDNTGEISFSNNSTIYISTSFRSATLHRLHISEYGKICNNYPDRAEETKTGSLQAIKPGNNVIIESTAEGSNDFQNMWEQAKEVEARFTALDQDPIYSGKDFKPVFLGWIEDPDCVSSVSQHETKENKTYFEEVEAVLGTIITTEQRNFWIMQEREIGHKIKQEYPSTDEEAFEKANDGSYYRTLFNLHILRQNRLVKGLYDPNLEVNVSMDLGINDTFTLFYYQIFDEEVRLIEDYQNWNEGLEHYVNHMNESKYRINWVVCPHDIRVKELGTGKTRERVLRELGVTRIRVLEKLPISDGIEMVRHMLKNMWIDTQCHYAIDCLKNYSKEWDDRYKVWKNKPVHNQWSHGADNFRYMATANIKKLDKPTNVKKQRNMFVYDGLAL